ncbi:hypothetical protein COL5a_005425 [Colletotrichum fioriniae]|nr:hypothetical protein COL5a_005425 [Colletotrichum fioriniae]
MDDHAVGSMLPAASAAAALAQLHGHKVEPEWEEMRPAVGPARPRKQSVTKRGREAHHKKQKSRGSAADWLRRIQNDERLRPGNNDRKALSAEPSADYGKRWEDLIDAADQAASAAGDIDEDRTPVRSFHALAS